MKRTNYLFILIVAVIGMFSLTSCESVAPGHKGVEVSFGGETNMHKIYNEGMHTGFHWLYDDLIEYDCRERTIVSDYEFNDLNNMETAVEISVDYSYDPTRVNILHTKITDVETKLKKTIKSAGKEVIPQYGAVDLNLTKRGDAENKLEKILAKELPEFYLVLYRVQITDVDLPQAISTQAKKTAEQIEKNKLAAYKAEEQRKLGEARVAKAQADANAAKFEADRLKYLTSPAMLKYKSLEVQMKWAEKGVSPYGSHNIFGDKSNLLLSR